MLIKRDSLNKKKYRKILFVYNYFKFARLGREPRIIYFIFIYICEFAAEL